MTHFLQISLILWQNYLKTFQRGQKQLAIPLKMSGNARLGTAPFPAFQTERFLTGVLFNARKGTVPKRAFPDILPWNGKSMSSRGWHLSRL